MPTSDPTIQQVYERWKDSDEHLAAADWCEGCTLAFAGSELWAAVKAHVEARCVWTPEHQDWVMSPGFTTSCGHDATDLMYGGGSPSAQWGKELRGCPYCMRLIELKEAPNANP